VFFRVSRARNRTGQCAAGDSRVCHQNTPAYAGAFFRVSRARNRTRRCAGAFVRDNGTLCFWLYPLHENTPRAFRVFSLSTLGVAYQRSTGLILPACWRRGAWAGGWSIRWQCQGPGQRQLLRFQCLCWCTGRGRCAKNSKPCNKCPRRAPGEKCRQQKYRDGGLVPDGKKAGKRGQRQCGNQCGHGGGHTAKGSAGNVDRPANGPHKTAGPVMAAAHLKGDAERDGCNHGNHKLNQHGKPDRSSTHHTTPVTVLNKVYPRVTPTARHPATSRASTSRMVPER